MAWDARPQARKLRRIFQRELNSGFWLFLTAERRWVSYNNWMDIHAT